MPHSLFPYGGGYSIDQLPDPFALPAILVQHAYLRFLLRGLLYVSMPYDLYS